MLFQHDTNWPRKMTFDELPWKLLCNKSDGVKSIWRVLTSLLHRHFYASKMTAWLSGNIMRYACRCCLGILVSIIKPYVYVLCPLFTFWLMHQPYRLQQKHDQFLYDFLSGKGGKWQCEPLNCNLKQSQNCAPWCFMQVKKERLRGKLRR